MFFLTNKINRRQFKNRFVKYFQHFILISKILGTTKEIFFVSNSKENWVWKSRKFGWQWKFLTKKVILQSTLLVITPNKLKTEFVSSSVWRLKSYEKNPTHLVEIYEKSEVFCPCSLWSYQSGLLNCFIDWNLQYPV